MNLTEGVPAMRNVWKLALAFLFVPEGALFSQTVDGTVHDSRTGLPLVGASVMLSPSGKATATDQSGQFRIRDVAPGPCALRISHVGYETFETSFTLDRQGRTFRISLQAVPMPGPEIEVSALRAVPRVSPVTFSELREGDLREQYYVQDIPVLLSDLPSSTFYSEGGSGIGYNYLRIRGFDQRRLAVMINGVPQNDPEDHNVYWVDFIDLLGGTENIQVQRGGGSAFYGPPAIGGSINIVTGDFADRKGFRLEAGTGSYRTSRYALSFGSGLLDGKYTLFGRLSRLRTDGYRDHSWVDAASYYATATRYDQNFTTRLTVYGGPLEDGLAYYGLPKFAVKDRDERRKNYSSWSVKNGAYTWKQERRPQEVESFSQPHYEMLNEWRVNESVTLNNTLFLVTGKGYFDYDASGWTDTTYFRMTTAYGFPNPRNPVDPIIRAFVDNTQWGWLPRVTVEHGAGTMVAGLELRSHRSLHWGRIQWAENLPEGLDPDRRYYEYRGAKLIGSAFAQESYRLSDRFSLMGSVQAVFNRYRLYDEKFVGTDFTVDYFFVNPRLGANLNLSETWNLYGNLSYTQREPRLKNLYDAGESSGGAIPQFAVNPNGEYDFSSPIVKPERLLNLEIGAGFLTEKVRMTINGYAMNFEDEIIKKGGLDRFGQPVTGNAERTLHLGLEASARIALHRTLDFDVNALVCRSRLVRYTIWQKDRSRGVSVPVSLDGNRIAGFPEMLANARLTWRWGGVTASLACKYVGDQYTDNFQSEENKVDPFTVFNATLGYRTPPFLGFRGVDIRLAVNNLFDALYAQSGEGDQFFVGAERNAFLDIAVDW
ncbi:MAG: TonB-dependent receptor [Bacteroidota bacterium]|nr:TonB-dependent receptor [Bacteroidota bacterium]